MLDQDPPIPSASQSEILRREQARQKEIVAARLRAERAREQADRAWEEADAAQAALRLLGMEPPGGFQHHQRRITSLPSANR